MQKTNVNRYDERSMNCLRRSHQRCNSQAAAFLLSNDAEQIHGAVRRQNIWLRLGLRLAEFRPHHGVDIKRRSCGAASVDVG